MYKCVVSLTSLDVHVFSIGNLVGCTNKCVVLLTSLDVHVCSTAGLIWVYRNYVSPRGHVMCATHGWHTLIMCVNRENYAKVHQQTMHVDCIYSTEGLLTTAHLQSRATSDSL